MQPERALLHVVDFWDHDHVAFQQHVREQVVKHVQLHGGALRPVGTWGMLAAPWGAYPRTCRVCSELVGKAPAARVPLGVVPHLVDLSPYAEADVKLTEARAAAAEAPIAAAPVAGATAEAQPGG